MCAILHLCASMPGMDDETSSPPGHFSARSRKHGSRYPDRPTWSSTNNGEPSDSWSGGPDPYSSGSSNEGRSSGFGGNPFPNTTPDYDNYDGPPSPGQYGARNNAAPSNKGRNKTPKEQPNSDYGSGGSGPSNGEGYGNEDDYSMFNPNGFGPGPSGGLMPANSNPDEIETDLRSNRGQENRPNFGSDSDRNDNDNGNERSRDGNNKSPRYEYKYDIPKDSFQTDVVNGQFGSFVNLPNSFESLIKSDTSFLEKMTNSGFGGGSEGDGSSSGQNYNDNGGNNRQQNSGPKPQSNSQDSSSDYYDGPTFDDSSPFGTRPDMSSDSSGPRPGQSSPIMGPPPRLGPSNAFSGSSSAFGPYSR